MRPRNVLDLAIPKFIHGTTCPKSATWLFGVKHFHNFYNELRLSSQFCGFEYYVLLGPYDIRQNSQRVLTFSACPAAPSNHPGRCPTTCRRFWMPTQGRIPILYRVLSYSISTDFRISFLLVLQSSQSKISRSLEESMELLLSTACVVAAPVPESSWVRIHDILHT